MALSGSFSAKSSRGNYYYVVNWSAVQNIEQNKSTITMQHYLNADNGWGLNISSSSGSYSQVDGGGTQYYTYSAINIGSGGGSKHLGTTTHEVYHSADGTKSITLSARMNSSYLNYPSPSLAVTLDTIPRTSSFTITDSTINFGQALSITIQRASTSFTHKVVYSFFEQSHTVNGATTSSSYTIPLTWVSEIPNTTQGQGTVTVQTYSGSTLIGSSSKTFTLTVPNNIVPTFTSITSVPNPQLTGFAGVYIQNKNGIKATVNGAQGVYGSTITKYQISTSVGNTGNTATLTTPIISSSGSVTISATITDSRNRTATKSIIITYQNYQEPYLVNAVVQRVNTGGSYDPNGTRVAVKPVVSFSSVNNLNSIDVLRYRYKATSGSWSSYINTTSNVTTYFNADADNSYVVEFSYSDKIISENIIQEFSVGSTISIIDIKGNGNGLAFGGSSEIDNAVEVKNNWNLIVNGGVVDGLISEEQTGRIFVRKYISGKMEMFGTYTATLSADGALIIPLDNDFITVYQFASVDVRYSTTATEVRRTNITCAIGGFTSTQMTVYLRQAETGLPPDISQSNQMDVMFKVEGKWK